MFSIVLITLSAPALYKSSKSLPSGITTAETSSLPLISSFPDEINALTPAISESNAKITLFVIAFTNLVCSKVKAVPIVATEFIIPDLYKAMISIKPSTTINSFLRFVFVLALNKLYRVFFFLNREVSGELRYFEYLPSSITLPENPIILLWESVIVNIILFMK